MVLETLELFPTPYSRPCFNIFVDKRELTPPFYSVSFLFPLFPHWRSTSLIVQPFRNDITFTSTHQPWPMQTPGLSFLMHWYLFFRFGWHMPPLFRMAGCPQVCLLTCFYHRNSLARYLSNITQNYPLLCFHLVPLTFHSVVCHFHCPDIIPPYCSCSILEMSPECLIPHASKYSPFLVLALCIHLPYTVYIFLLPVHGRKHN